MSARPAHRRLRRGLVLGLVLWGLPVLAPAARAADFCISDISQPLTISLPGVLPPITPDYQLGFALTSPISSGAVLATIRSEQYTDSGYTAVLVFDRFITTPPPFPPPDGVFNVVEVRRGQWSGTIFTLKIGNCPARPAITSSGPADGATGVAADAPVFAVFDQPMDRVTTAAAFTLVRAGDGSAVPGSVVFVGDRVAIFKPSAPLAPGSRYTATVASSASSQAGQPLATAKSWSFTTVSPPVVQSVSPADGATGVPRSVRLVAVFDRPMAEASVVTAFKLARTTDRKPIAGTVALAYGGRVAVFTPRRALGPRRGFTATITTAATALDGQSLSTTRSWAFRTSSHPKAP